MTNEMVDERRLRYDAWTPDELDTNILAEAGPGTNRQFSDRTKQVDAVIIGKLTDFFQAQLRIVEGKDDTAALKEALMSYITALEDLYHRI
ncbi:MAG: hypothetical protein FWF83_03015 [Clostridiales bacterium]|nr:hypothetical protein [Clostridiales bacterium]